MPISLSSDCTPFHITINRDIPLSPHNFYYDVHSPFALCYNKLMKNRKHPLVISHKTIYILFFVVLLACVAVFSVDKLRPITHYTIYQLDDHGKKREMKHMTSLSRSIKAMRTLANPTKKINAVVEDDKGKRLAMAYGIVDLQYQGTPTLSYYNEYKNINETIRPSFGADGIYVNTIDYNGTWQVEFQQSRAVGMLPIKDIALLNVFDPKEVASFSKYVVKDGKLYHHITTSIKDSRKDYTLALGDVPATTLLDGTYYSWDGINFYPNIKDLVHDKNKESISKKNRSHFFPSYVYKNINKPTQYTAKEINTYIAQSLPKDSVLQHTGEAFINAQKKYHINALVLLSIACVESDQGTDQNALQHNALYQVQHKKKYASASDSILSFASAFTNTYVNKKSSSYNGNFLGNKGSGINITYSSDPYWGERVAQQYYRIDTAMGGKDKNIPCSEEREQ